MRFIGLVVKPSDPQLKREAPPKEKLPAVSAEKPPRRTRAPRK